MHSATTGGTANPSHATVDGDGYVEPPEDTPLIVK
jgi:hypothetical protein